MKGGENMADFLSEGGVIIIIAAAVFILNKKLGFAAFLSEKVGRLTYNIILLLLLIAFFGAAYFLRENTVTARIFLGLSAGIITILGGYGKK